MSSSQQALKRLKEGNERFVSEGRRDMTAADPSRRRSLAAGQAPFAVILGCSDSRVPPEVVFDQGLGDLFVVRVAGNLVAPHQLGSIEFAVGGLGARLVVVLGHSGCGAVAATVDEILTPTVGVSPHLLSIVSSIRPSVEPLVESAGRQDPAGLLERAVRANIGASVEKIGRDSQVLAKRVTDGELHVVGAEYSLTSGRVEFLEA